MEISRITPADILTVCIIKSKEWQRHLSFLVHSILMEVKIRKGTISWHYIYN